jgi:hypothetical protein
MASIRARLTGAYAITMVATVTALGGVLFAAQRTDRAHQLARQAYEDADLAVRIVGRVAATGEPVTATSDPLLGPSSEAIHVVTPALRNVLEGLPDYVLVLDSAGRTLYNSFAVRQLDPDDQVQLSRIAIAMPASAPAHQVRLSDRDLLVAVNTKIPGGTAVARVVSGVDLASGDPGPADLQTSGLLLALLVVVVSIVGAYGWTSSLMKSRRSATAAASTGGSRWMKLAMS